MNKLYEVENYVIAERDGITYEYAKSKTIYQLRDDVYTINENTDGRMSISVTEIDNNEWFLLDGITPYTEATFVAFLRANTGNFKSAVSIPALSTVLQAGNTTEGNNIKFTTEDKLQGLATPNYINFNDGENDGIFHNLISGNGFVRLFEAVTWIMNNTIVRLQAPSIQLITEVFRLRDTSSNFESQINMDKLTANRVQQLPDKAGTFAMVEDIPTTLTIKSGALDGANFVGVPRILNVIFITPFVDANYSPVITGIPNRNFTVENVTNVGFTISSNSASAMIGLVYWTATYHGEVSGN